MVYGKKWHTHPTNKLRLNFKSRMNPRLKETVIINAEEKMLQNSKSRKRQRKTHVEKKKEKKPRSLQRYTKTY